MRSAVLAVLLAVPVAAQSGLDCVAEALGGVDRLDAIDEVAFDASTVATLGGRDTRTTARVSLRRDSVVWQTRVGDAPQTVRVSAEQVTVQTGAASQPLRDPDARHVRQAGWLHLPVLWMRRAEVSAEGDCAGLLKLTVPDFPEPLILQLGDAGRPRLLSTFRERAGERVYLAIRYGEYRERDGVWLPRQIAQAEGGVERGVTTVSNVEIGDRR